jgi:hypothetical protein
MLRGVNLRTNANVISPSSFQSRKAYLVAGYKDGSFLAEPENRGKPPANPMSDPAMMEGMMGMMKGNVAMMVPQTLIMGWINAFFSGFVISTSQLLLHANWAVQEMRTVMMPPKAHRWKSQAF